MAIITKSVARYTKVGDKKSPKVNYLTQLALGYADIDEVARKVARVTSQAEGDVLAVCRELTYQIADILKSGRSVRLGKLGSFQARVSSTPTADAETRALAGTNLKGVRVGFYAGTLLRSEMASATDSTCLQREETAGAPIRASPTGWQWLQIWIGRIALLWTAIQTGLKLYSNSKRKTT